MKKAPVLHPFLFSLFPILALYAYNIKSVPVPLREVAWPLALSVASAVLLFLALSAILKAPARAGLIVSLIVLWFLSFGHLASWVAGWTGGLFNRSLFFATALMIGLAAFFIGRTRSDFAGLTRVLNIVATTLVLLNIVSAAKTLASRPQIAAGPDIKVSRQTAMRPNIYYLVFDAYTRADILNEVFSYDNSGFLSALEARGFYIAPKSYANYGYTYHSLASSLNFTYLDKVAKDVGKASIAQDALYAMIYENRVMAFLKNLGYKVYCYSSNFKPGDIRNVDRSLGFEESTSEFRSTLLGTTPIPLLFGSRGHGSAFAAHRAHILDAFRVLEESPRLERPFFFFVHLMVPHPPFVFGRGGQPAEPRYLFSILDGDRMHGGSEASVHEYVVGYREQLAFLNKKILETVDSIVSLSPEPPIIILQGDHGSRAYTDFDHPDASYLKESMAILNAYLLPADGREQLYTGISPVNTFRLIFTRYFGADLGLLEDRSFWCTWRRPYEFIPFDERTYGETIESVRAKTAPKPPAVRMK